jgi:pimeloyl-ACP methyl ester carboxylesterase
MTQKLLPVRADQTADPMIPIPVPKQPAFTEGLADIGDGKIWYTDTGGAGIPVVMVHPASGSGLVWLYQRPALHAAGYRVITWSRRSHYGSSPVDLQNPGIASEDLFKLVNHLGLGTFHLVCCAAGGRVGTDFGFSHPDRVRSIVVSSNSFGVSDGIIAETAARIRPEGWDEWPWWFRELGPSYRAANPEGTKLWIELEHQGAAPDGHRQKTTHIATEAMLGTFKPPTLLMTGDADTSTPPATLRMVASRIPGCEIFVLPECGHSAYWERPDLFNAAVLDFIGRH